MSGEENQYNYSVTPSSDKIGSPYDVVINAVDGLGMSNTFTRQIQVVDVPEVCNNDVDDDGDGLNNCADSECDNNPNCNLDVNVEVAVETDSFVNMESSQDKTTLLKVIDRAVEESLKLDVGNLDGETFSLESEVSYAKIEEGNQLVVNTTSLSVGETSLTVKASTATGEGREEVILNVVGLDVVKSGNLPKINTNLAEDRDSYLVFAKVTVDGVVQKVVKKEVTNFKTGTPDGWVLRDLSQVNDGAVIDIYVWSKVGQGWEPLLEHKQVVWGEVQ